MTKVEVSRNYFIVTDTATNERWRRLKSVVQVESQTTNGTLISFNDQYNEYRSEYFDQIRDSAGNPFANLAAFWAWIDANTGSGGSSAGGYVPSPYIVEKVFFEEDLVPDPHVIAFTACEAFIEFTGTGGKFCGIPVEDGFGRGFGNNPDNLEYQFPDCQSPLVGKITITYGRKEL